MTAHGPEGHRPRCAPARSGAGRRRRHVHPRTASRALRPHGVGRRQGLVRGAEDGGRPRRSVARRQALPHARYAAGVPEPSDTMRSPSSPGSDPNMRAFTTVYTAPVSAIPTPSTTTTASVKPRSLSRRRPAKRTSCAALRSHGAIHTSRMSSRVSGRLPSKRRAVAAAVTRSTPRDSSSRCFMSRWNRNSSSSSRSWRSHAQARRVRPHLILRTLAAGSQHGSPDLCSHGVGRRPGLARFRVRGSAGPRRLTDCRVGAACGRSSPTPPETL